MNLVEHSMLHARIRVLASLFSVAGLALVFTGTPAAQLAAARVLVMPFAVQVDPAAPNGALAARWLGEAASTLIADELSAGGYAALPREDRVAVFDRLHLPMSSELTRATLIRVAELIGASEVVFGELRLGSDLSVRARTIRLDSGHLLADVTDRGALSDIFDVFARVARQVGQQTGRPGVQKPSRVPPLPLPAFENYIKGLLAATPAVQQRFLESAMTQAPRDGRILTALWSVYTDLGLHDKALAVSSAVPADAPQQPGARFSQALSMIELKRFDGAVSELTALHNLRRRAPISNAIGVAELRRSATPAAAVKAAPYFERAVNESPRDTDYLFNLGYARAVAGESAPALQWLREAVRHNTADGDAHLVTAAVLGTVGRGAEAQRELELARLLGTSLDTVPAAVSRVPPGLERVRTRLEESVLATPGAAELQRAIYLAPYEHEPHLQLGRLYQRAGRLGEAIDEFTVAIWCKETAAARIALGSALVESGDRDAARGEFTRALALAPDSAEAREWLRKIGGQSARGAVLTSCPASCRNQVSAKSS